MLAHHRGHEKLKVLSFAVLDSMLVLCSAVVALRDDIKPFHRVVAIILPSGRQLVY